jgi:hypothetical protein
MRLAVILLAFMLIAPPLAAQDFRPPEEDTEPSKIEVGITGFSARGGVDFKGANQLIASIAVDVIDFYTERIRLRPSGEIGVGGTADTYVGNLDLMYRFTPDTEKAVPYIGAGFSVYGQTGCGPAPGCPKVWPTLTLGFELNLRPGINWLIEYRGEDALRRTRIFIGLSTRRPS